MIRNLHVTYNSNNKEGRWEVKYGGDPTPIKVTISLDDAIKSAKQMAKDEQCDLVIHGINGDIQDRLSYR